MEDSDAQGSHDVGPQLEPVIHEIVRTQVCFPRIKLLVDLITIHTLPNVLNSSKNKALRLLLSDGEKTNNAVASPI